MSEKIDLDKFTMKDCKFAIRDIKPNYNVTFHRDGKQIGALDFNGPEMTFTGDAEQSAKVFFDWIAESFKSRLEQERAAEREACAKALEELHVWPIQQEMQIATIEDCIAAIRARGQS